MKKISLLLLLMVLATNVYSQKTNEERASKITNEISEVLSLNQEETAKVYKIQLKRFQEVVSIREKYKDDAETRKPELKKVYKRLFGKLKKTLGKAKMQQWAAYKREIGRE
jgi:pyruvate/2-oxoglutarate dehydrogenase complex dihydrolipoamide acyltransferase (E2) component